ncbi:hypothetical protein [Providencia rettgeri]|jgi:hypothetical protein|uniref:hypothetical protein n=1 Tax=Providencia rettgeri TaxID=587 RepID=UPI0023621F63|nr:hypothetical protein [Providencia rettgeri]MDR2225453.1 hypothetical protein [Providencia sp.]
MKNTQIIPVKNPIYTPSAAKINCNLITENTSSIRNKNPIKKFITNLFKIKNTSIINKIRKDFLLNMDNTNLKKTKNINKFIDILKNKNIYVENIAGSSFIDKCLKSRPENFNDPNTLILNKKNYIGHGSYGVAYHVGNFVIKIPKNREHLDTHFAKLGRSRRILADINQNKDFCRVLTLKNGAQVLISKFIDGQSITGEEAYQFVKSRGRILHDYNVNGNVRKDKQGNLYLIDADFATLPIEARHHSLGSNQLYRLFPEYTHNYLKFKEKIDKPK